VGSEAAFCEHVIEPSGPPPPQRRTFLYQVNNYQLLKEDTIPRCHEAYMNSD